MWAEEKPSILSVLKFDSEVEDPVRQNANGGGGKKGRHGRRVFFYYLTARSVNSPTYSANSDHSLVLLVVFGLVSVWTSQATLL